MATEGPREALQMLTCQRLHPLLSRCFSTSGQMLPRSHPLWEDLFLGATHLLPAKFMLNKAHSLAFLLGSDLLGFEKVELRRGNGSA